MHRTVVLLGQRTVATRRHDRSIKNVLGLLPYLDLTGWTISPTLRTWRKATGCLSLGSEHVIEPSSSSSVTGWLAGRLVTAKAEELGASTGWLDLLHRHPEVLEVTTTIVSAETTTAAIAIARVTRRS